MVKAIGPKPDLRQVQIIDLDGDGDDDLLALINGRVEDKIEGRATWRDGDWNGDGEFNTSYLVLAFQSGRYIT